MIPAVRTQVDRLGDLYSASTSVDYTGAVDMARQEYAQEADINHVLRQYQVTGSIDPTRLRVPRYGDVDFDIDLHTARIAVADSQRVFLALPEELRKKYGSPGKMLDAMHSGELASDLHAAHAAFEAASEAAKAATEGSTPPTPSGEPTP